MSIGEIKIPSWYLGLFARFNRLIHVDRLEPHPMHRNNQSVLVMLMKRKRKVWGGGRRRRRNQEGC